MKMMSSPITVSEAAEWYTTPTEEISQGDIVRLIPWGLIEAPITVCQPVNTDKSGRANYFEHGDGRPKRSREFLHASFNTGFGIIVWPDCQIDKAKNQKKPEQRWLVAVAPVIPISKLDLSLHTKVQSFDRAQWFPLPACSLQDTVNTVGRRRF
jgi:hypothetical protein